jgi:predicted nucleic acid binding AN1-type Zn finger protein
MGISTLAVVGPRAVLLVIIIGVIIVCVMRKKNNPRSYRSRNYRKSRNRQMPAPSRDCAIESCGTISVMPFVCKFCESSFCIVHRLPEKHECVVLASMQKRF